MTWPQTGGGSPSWSSATRRLWCFDPGPFSPLSNKASASHHWSRRRRSSTPVSPHPPWWGSLPSLHPPEYLPSVRYYSSVELLPAGCVHTCAAHTSHIRCWHRFSDVQFNVDHAALPEDNNAQYVNKLFPVLRHVCSMHLFSVSCIMWLISCIRADRVKHISRQIKLRPMHEI